jgi:hypothetical protein
MGLGNLFYKKGSPWFTALKAHRYYTGSPGMLILKGKTLRANLSSFEWILNFLRRAKRSQNLSKFRDCSQSSTSLSAPPSIEKYGKN